jgi:hypothetical protein
MNPLLDNFLVVAALAASAVYALFKLGPRALRRALLSRVAGWVGRAPDWCGLRGLAVRLGAAVQSSGSCGGCDNCGNEGAAAQASPPAGQSLDDSGARRPASHSTSGSEIRVPLARIGRRPR